MSTSANHKPDAPASSPGTILKRCREYHGISLDEAAETTKIGVNYLSALENDQISAFASLAYLKGFLRIYATHLGLNPDDMMRLYEKLYSPAGSQKEGQAASDAQAGPARRRRFSWRKLALPAALLLLIIIWSFLSRSPTLQPTPTATPETAPPAAPIQPVRSSARPTSPTSLPQRDPVPAEMPQVKPASGQGAVQKTPPEKARGFFVRMKVTQTGTLDVTIDGTTTQNYELTVGDVIEWKADRNISLELSNAGGVEAELNGRQLKPFGPSGKPAVIVLDADGVRP